MFSKKLAFLMDITQTSSSALASACHLDSSYVSRLKNGSRPLPKNPVFLDDMVSFLSRHIFEDYQQNILATKLSLSVWPSGQKESCRILKKWLSAEDTYIFEGIPSADIPSKSEEQSESPSASASSAEKADSYYFGPAGKRQAVLNFFDLLLQKETPTTLLLSSEEEMGWMYEDSSFAADWTKKFQAILSKGNRVKIIHHIGRDMNEMIEALSKWIPLYATGLIEPYYYPKIRDEVLQRTLFIAQGCAAIVSTSVQRRSEGMLNELITDEGAIRALSMEFDNMLDLCRPLMHVLTAERSTDLFNSLNLLLSKPGRIICLTDMPGLSTMPKDVAFSMQKRVKNSSILKRWYEIDSFLASLSEDDEYIEIMPETFPVKNGSKIPLPCADLLDASGMTYEDNEWEMQLENIEKMKAQSDRHHIVTVPSVPSGMFLFVKEGQGIFMLRNLSPCVSFALSEPQITSSCWDYLLRKII